jgi:SARP family transcriptional regulator, regulator of embCAB operon
MTSRPAMPFRGSPEGAHDRAPALTFRVLGPLEVLRDGEPCTPTAPKQRALLALLLLHANELLPTARIVDELWGYRPPRSAVAALQSYVTATRRTLSPGAAGRAGTRRHPVLRTHPSGYVLHVRPDQLDLVEFRTLAARGRSGLAEGNCDQAGDLFRSALALWRGPALADVTHHGVLDSYTVRLEEERLALLERRIAVDLCQGHAADVVGELEELCQRYPLREGFQEQLMLALHASGRRAEALGVYTRIHRIMVEEAGIEPGRGLRELQEVILRGGVPSPAAHGCGSRG